MADVTAGLNAADNAVASGKGVELHAPSARAHAPVRMWDFIGLACLLIFLRLNSAEKKPG